MPTTRTIRVLDQSWQLLITRNMPLLHQWISSTGNIRFMKEYGLKTPLYFLALTKEGFHTHVFYSIWSLKRLRTELLRLLSNKQAMRHMERLYVRKGADLKRALQRAQRSLTPRTWKAFCREYGRYTPALNVTALGGLMGTERLTELMKAAHIKDRTATLATVTYPSKHTPLFQSQLDLLAIGAKIQAKKLTRREVDAALHRWLKRHGHIPVNFCENPWTIGDARQQLQQVMKTDCAAERRLLDRSHRQKVREAQRALRRVPRNIGTVAHSLQTITTLNQYRKNVFCFVSLGMTDLYKEIAERMGLRTWRECYYFTPGELEDGLRRARLPWKKMIRQRRLTAYVADRDEFVRFLPKQTAKRLASFVYGATVQPKHTHRTTAILRGLGANRGIVHGTVRVVLSSKDFSKVRTGDILVAPMTSVDYVPVMKKAAAFVTNEGGITSHASIVSREMNKPCVVGTGVATIVLKDGDLVEVDATKGIVRKV